MEYREYIDGYKFGQAIAKRFYEQSPTPTHKLTIPKGTILKGINPTCPDIIVSQDVDITFSVSIELYADNSNNHIDCHSRENYIPVNMEGVF
jgi:hypothetical protein